MSSVPRQIARPRTQPRRRPVTGRPLLRVIDGGRASAADAKRRSTIIFLTWSGVAGAALIFGVVLLNVFVAQGSFKLEDLQSQVEQQSNEYRRMRFEVAKAEAPARVAEAATALGLVVPDTQEYILGLPVEHPAQVAEKALSGDQLALKAGLDGEP
ncbi:MAG TPA: hypothetical protein VI541_04520 [Actinomycetota bacterium]|nr:hypothetical protein [Actinomycetota bacterium]